MATTSREDHSDDYDSSCSSITVPGSSRSWLSNLSFGSRRLSSASGDLSPHKPHKANHAAWESMRWLRGAAGIVSLEHFQLLRRLGSGDIGNVYLCQIRNPLVGLPQSFYAMKVVDREALAIRKKLKRADMEKEILGLLDHPFLPTLYAAFEASHYSCLVMEFCPGGDLYAARQRRSGRRFNISSVKFYAAEVILAIEYLHMMGIVYRDLKPENVLIREDGHIMLSDFDLCLKCDVVPRIVLPKRPSGEVRSVGKSSDRSSSSSCVGPLKPVLSCFSKRTKPMKTTTIIEQAQADHLLPYPEPELVAEPSGVRSKSFVGTHEYLAPEIISGEGHGSGVDWWTLGVFIYEMMYGKTPFKGENNEKTLVNILKQPLTFPRIGVSSSQEYEEMVKIQDLITKLLAKNQKKRMGSVKGSTEIKRHEFFKGVNWALIRSVKPPEIPRDLQNIRRRSYVPKLSKKERDEPYQIPHHHVDYF